MCLETSIKIPLPKIAPIVVATLAIGADLDAPALSQQTKQVLSGLLQHDISVVGYASDGSAVECSLQHLVVKSAPAARRCSIEHPNPSCSPIQLNIPFLDERMQKPIAMIQDPKHLLKTFRNNLFSGTQLLVLGNYIAMYSHAHTIAFEKGTLYQRDVEKVDRQDDNAATWLFSGHTINWMKKHHPEALGFIVYLFVFGELIDACQNRHITLLERATMALRALFFLEMWEAFLAAAKYLKSQHFLSPAAVNIARTLIRGLLQLIIIYRDHVPGNIPLLPWLLTTEVCEHIFGICRQMVKDFNMLDFEYMVPKLFIQLREAVLTKCCSDRKARASGYNHTYGDARDINLQNLSMYPTDAQFRVAAECAHEQTESLWALLGIAPIHSSASITTLPSIQSWLPDMYPLSTLQPAGPSDWTEDDDESVTGGSDTDDDETSQLQEFAEGHCFDTHTEECISACM